jgi:hypothetical protein
VIKRKEKERKNITFYLKERFEKSQKCSEPYPWLSYIWWVEFRAAAAHVVISEPANWVNFQADEPSIKVLLRTKSPMILHIQSTVLLSVGQPNTLDIFFFFFPSCFSSRGHPGQRNIQPSSKTCSTPWLPRVSSPPRTLSVWNPISVWLSQTFWRLRYVSLILEHACNHQNMGNQPILVALVGHLKRWRPLSTSYKMCLGQGYPIGGSLGYVMIMVGENSGFVLRPSSIVDVLVNS